MSYESRSMTVFELVNHIGDYFLPAIQREFVWQSSKIESLFDSLLRGYPIGTLLLWDVQPPAIFDFPFYELIRDFDVRKAHNIKANLNARTNCFGILDGQQRITSLYIGLCGSYIEKVPRLWVTNPDAYPLKRLYMNLLYAPKPEDDGAALFQVKFLPATKAKHTDQAFWFLLTDILKYKTRNELRDFRRSTPYKDDDIFENNLDALWTAIHEVKHVHYFLEPSQELERVLKIFHRLNTGGTPLEHSDLLLSLATATWKQHDAREQVYHLVDYLNKNCGSTFYFSKNFILKTLLVCTEKDVRFRAENVSHKISLENIWMDVKKSLEITIKLLAQFGMNFQTLTAPNAAVCIAYYIYKRKLGESFLTDKSRIGDREQIRIWLLKSQLARIFGGQTDRVLTIIRGAIKDSLEKGNLDFPADSIEKDLQVVRPFSFSTEYIQSLVANTRYGQADTFSILGLLFPYLKFSQQQYSIDHLHPQAQFDRKSLEKLGLDKATVDFMLNNQDGLANLQLLPGSINSSKNKRPLSEWLEPDDTEPEAVKAIYRSWCLIPDVDLNIKNFKEFYILRQTKIVEALKLILGYTLPLRERVETGDEEMMFTEEEDELTTIVVNGGVGS